MYVRTIYATGDPAKIEGAIEALRAEAPKLLHDQPGYRGFGLFADRDLGKILMGSWWESPEAERASDQALRERRAALLSPFASSATADRWEAAVVTPPPQVEAGAGFRLGRIEFDPSDADTVVRQIQEGGLPRLQAIPGFASAALLIDRAAGRGTVGVVYKDRAALVASRGPQAAARAETVPKARMTVRSVEEFEVVLLERLPR